MGELHPNAQIVLKGFQAFDEGDMAAMKEVMANDVAWHSSGRSRFSGTYQGLDSVLQLFADISAEARIEQDLHAVLADDEHVVVLAKSTLTRGDKSLEAQNVGTFHVVDGKVTEAWFSGFDDYAADEFWE